MIGALRRAFNDRVWRPWKGYAVVDGTWRHVGIGALAVSLLGAAMITGGGWTSQGKNAAPAKAAQLVPSSRVVLGWREPDPTTTTTTTVVQRSQPRPQATAGRRTHGCAPRSLDQIPHNEDPSGDPRAVNPSSGAGGFWQILPSTWRSNGGTQYAPSADQATPEQQRAVAQKIYAEQGTAPWRSSGC